MGTGGESYQDQGLAAGVRPMPGRVIDDHVDVANARGHIEGLGTENGNLAFISLSKCEVVGSSAWG
jgi:hypothetical protein